MGSGSIVGQAGFPCLGERIAFPMRLATMAQNYLLAPIQECPSDYLVKDIKLAVLGTGSVGKSGKRRRTESAS